MEFLICLATEASNVGVKTSSKKNNSITKNMVCNHTKFMRGHILRMVYNHTKFIELYVFSMVCNHTKYIRNTYRGRYEIIPSIIQIHKIVQVYD